MFFMAAILELLINATKTAKKTVNQNRWPQNWNGDIKNIGFWLFYMTIRRFQKRGLFMAAILDLQVLLKIGQQKPIHCTRWPPKPNKRHQNHSFLLIRAIFKAFPKICLFMAAILDFLKMLNRYLLAPSRFEISGKNTPRINQNM